MPPMLIGLTGYKGSGKTTAARHLCLEHDFTRTAFADPVKDFAYMVLPKPLRFVVDVAGWDRLKGYGPVRRYLQRVGTEGGRQTVGETVWVDAWVSRAIRLLESGYSVVVDDVRFPNEIEAVRDLGGFVARIERPGCDTKRPRWAPWRRRKRDAHASEQRLDLGLDGHLVPNVGTIQQLTADVDLIVDMHRIVAA